MKLWLTLIDNPSNRGRFSDFREVFFCKNLLDWGMRKTDMNIEETYLCAIV